MKIKSLIAYCIVKKKNPKLDAMSVYADKDLVLEKDEMAVKVRIEVIE